MGYFVRTFCYFLVALVAVVTYFHIQCLNEKGEAEKVPKKNRFDPFKPDETDCQVQLPFADKGSDVYIHIPITWVFQQWAPCALMKMTHAISGTSEKNLEPDPKTLKNLTVHDARKK